MLSQTLNNMLKKNVKFVWTEFAQMVFDNLKKALSTTLVSALPNFNQEFIIEIYTSECVIGPVMLQQCHPVSYISKMM